MLMTYEGVVQDARGASDGYLTGEIRLIRYAQHIFHLCGADLGWNWPYAVGGRASVAGQSVARPDDAVF